MSRKQNIPTVTRIILEEQIEVHEQIGSARQEPPVPAVDPRPAILAALELAEAWTVVGALGGSGVTVAASADEATVREAALADAGVLRYVEGKPIRKFVYVRGKLANLVV